jgi:Flp pilus assembly pilin Flp
MKKIGALFRDKNGHIAIEYCMIAMLIALAIIVALTSMGQSVKGMFDAILPAFAAPTP